MPALAVKQRLKPRALPIRQNATDDGGRLQRGVSELRDAHGNNYGLGPNIDRLARPGNRRVRTERGNGFALGRDQLQLASFGITTTENARGEGVAEADD